MHHRDHREIVSYLFCLHTSRTPGTNQRLPALFHSHEVSSQKTFSRPSSGYANDRPASFANGLPPTPPMSDNASFEPKHNNSPSSNRLASVSRASTRPSTTSTQRNYFHEHTPPTDDHFRRVQHRGAPPPPPQHYASAPAYTHAPAPVYQQQQQQQPPHHPPPAPMYNQMHYQRPLPQQFPPPPPPQHYAPPPPGQWQPTAHHHYLNPSQGPTYPQSQDRYICPQCSKAFSRPSSLRIHSHSHTGEKPFQCPHAGCGKAFSVRSNMKRHERGCHSFEISAGGR